MSFQKRPVCQVLRFHSQSYPSRTSQKSRQHLAMCSVNVLPKAECFQKVLSINLRKNSMDFIWKLLLNAGPQLLSLHNSFGRFKSKFVLTCRKILFQVQYTKNRDAQLPSTEALFERLRFPPLCIFGQKTAKL